MGPLSLPVRAERSRCSRIGPNRASGSPPAETPGGCPGFTLVELLIVVAIIALLVSIMLPSLANARMLALRSVCAGNLHQMHLSLTMYLNDHDDVYPCAADPVSTSPSYWLWMGRGWRNVIAPYVDSGVNKDNPSILFCPGDPAEPAKYESTSYAYSLAFYHSRAQINSMNAAADTYSNPQPSVAQRIQDVLAPDRKIVIGDWTSNHPQIDNDKGWWCWEGERNFLFADGQIQPLPAERIRPARDNFPDPNLTVDGIKGMDL